MSENKKKLPKKILKILPNESTRIAAEKSLLIMDIVVELEDGSIANVESYGKEVYEFVQALVGDVTPIQQELEIASAMLGGR